MTNDPFQRPSNDFFAAKDFQGNLVLFENVGQPYKKVTKFDKPDDPSTVIDADVTIIDAAGGAKVFVKSTVFGMALVGTLSRALPGKPLLGRIGQGVAAAGQSAPWVLDDYTDADAQLAGQYLTQRASGTFQAPTQQAAPVAAPAPVQAAPVAAAPQQVSVPAGVDPAAFAAAMAALAGGGLNPAVVTDDSPPF
jgi:hypothetical protein